MRASQRVVVNTVAQYTRTLISMVLSLYTVRIVLSCLGQSDFGIYNLVAGVVAMLSFFTNSLASTTQRFVSYYQGKGIKEEVKNVFNNSLVIHIVLGLAIIAILEAVAPLLFNGFLNIPYERIEAAKIVYHTVVIMIFVNFISAPFSALLISHENIVFISAVGILESALKVALVLLLAHSSFDKLVMYGFVMLGMFTFAFLAYVIFCAIRYEECIFPSIRRVQKNYIKELSSFAGWSIYGSACIAGRNQGISIVLNRAFGTVINGAWGIGSQVAGYTGILSEAIVNAMRPQIIKAEGAGERQRAIWLSGILSKIVFFLISIIGIPFIFEIDSILSIWLGNPPEGASSFCIMFIIATLVDAFTIGMTHLNNAIGRIRLYTILMSTPKLLTLVFAIILVKSDASLLPLMIVYVVTEACCSILRIPLVARQSGLVTSEYFKNVIFKELFPLLICIFTCMICVHFFDFKWRFIVTICLSALTYSASMYYLGLSNDERGIVVSLVSAAVRKFKH